MESTTLNSCLIALKAVHEVRSKCLKIVCHAFSELRAAPTESNQSLLKSRLAMLENRDNNINNKLKVFLTQLSLRQLGKCNLNETKKVVLLLNSYVFCGKRLRSLASWDGSLEVLYNQAQVLFDQRLTIRSRELNEITESSKRCDFDIDLFFLLGRRGLG